MRYHLASSSVSTNSWCDVIAKSTWDFNDMYVVIMGVMVVEFLWAMLVISHMSNFSQAMH